MRTGLDPWHSNTRQVRPLHASDYQSFTLLIIRVKLTSLLMLGHRLGDISIPERMAVCVSSGPHANGELLLHRCIAKQDVALTRNACPDGKVLLASASQDKTLRIWTIQASSETTASKVESALPVTNAHSSELAQMIARQALAMQHPTVIKASPWCKHRMVSCDSHGAFLSGEIHGLY